MQCYIINTVWIADASDYSYTTEWLRPRPTKWRQMTAVVGATCWLLQLHIGSCTKVTEQQSNGTDVCCWQLAAVVGHRLAERQRIIFHFINRRLSSGCPGIERTAQTMTVCTPFSITYGYFHIRISDPKFDIRISRYWFTILGHTMCGSMADIQSATAEIRRRKKRKKERKKERKKGWLVGWGLTALLTQNRSYCACKFVGIFHSKLQVYVSICIHIHI